MTETDTSRSARGEALYAAHQEKVREAFQGKKFKILKEVHLEEDQRFETLFGNKGRHGVILEEVGNPDNRLIVGNTILRRVADEYGSVELPPEAQKRKRRTKAQKAEDDAAAAARKEEAAQLQKQLIADVLARSAEENSANGNASDEKSEENEVVSGLFANK